MSIILKHRYRKYRYLRYKLKDQMTQILNKIVKEDNKKGNFIYIICSFSIYVYININFNWLKSWSNKEIN